MRNVEPGGPAAAGGMEAGDVILSFNGRDITKSTDLPRVVWYTIALVQVWRKGGTRDLMATVLLELPYPNYQMPRRRIGA